MTWSPLDLIGLADQSTIYGVWGAGGSYWLAERRTQTDELGSLWRSTDGRTWRRSLELDQGLIDVSIGDGCDASRARAEVDCPLFLMGTIGVDGAIWRSADGGGTWARATIDDATGWSGAQDAAPVEMRGVVAVSDGFLAFGNGLPRASDTSGFLQSRFWRSGDGGVTWSRLPNVAPFGELVVRDVAVNGRVTVAVGGAKEIPGLAVALVSTDDGRTWSRSQTSGDEADGELSHVVAQGSGFISLGFASPAAVDKFPVREFLWRSDDGVAWRTFPAGDLEGGIVDDVVRFNDQIVAVGRGWTTAATGTWEAPFGPAIWTTVP